MWLVGTLPSCPATLLWWRALSHKDPREVSVSSLNLGLLIEGKIYEMFWTMAYIHLDKWLQYR